MTGEPSVEVVGAGVAGLVAATELAERGCAVRLVAASEGADASCCSWWAGGMLAPDCEGEAAEAEVAAMGAEAQGWWRARVPVTQNGSLVVAQPRDRGELTRFARMTQGHERLEAQGVADLEPDLGTRFPGGLFFAGEAHLDPRAALGLLHGRLRERGVVVERRRIDPGAPPEADWRIDCRGLAARDRLPDLRGVRGEMAVIRAPDVTLSRPVRLLHPRMPLYVVPRPERVFMVGATQIESEARGPVSVRSAVELLSAACALVPGFAEADVLEFGADLRPAFPDNVPRLVVEGDVLHINGLFRHGFLCAPALGRRAADHVLGCRHAPETDHVDHRQRHAP